jgi:hypothetical protein
VKPWLAYSLLRVGVFALVFALLMLADVEWWLSALIAAIVGFCVGYVFFGRLRDRVALDIAERRARPAADADSRAEDA